MNILGIWDGHDAGAALLVGGRIVAAVNEERVSRRKLEIRFPSGSIQMCLDLGAIAPGEVDVVAACGADVAKTLTRILPSLKERYYQVRRRQATPGVTSRASKYAKSWISEWGPNPVTRAGTRLALRRQLRRVGLGASRLVVFDHHRCHATAGACTSGFDRAVVVTIDGVGDGRSSTVSVFEQGTLVTIAHTPAAHSPGIFFEHVTNLLNMRELEDEGKVMALSHYAAPVVDNPLTSVIGAEGLRFRLAVPGRRLHAHLRRILWHYPNEQFARMAQTALERACLDVVRAAVRNTGISRVILSGGVASNIQVNRLVRLLPEVEDVFVFPHMGDGGLAVGAALAAALDEGEAVCERLPSLDLGPAFDRESLRQSLVRAGVAYEEPPAIADAVASALCDDLVVFWFQGRMEYGPRALGHRSILARPDRPDVRDRLNLVLKRRIWYQPFCPSILERDARRLFEDWKGCPDRFMTMSYSVHPEHRDRLSGVIGGDGTCRPQIVPEGSDAPIAHVLRAMSRRTGLGAVLNTSFNIHGEPLVCTPDEALDVFRRSGADALALGPFLVRRPVAV